MQTDARAWWAARQRQTPFRTRHATIRAPAVGARALESFGARVDRSVDRICAFLDVAPPASIHVTLTHRAQTSVTHYDEARIVISARRLPNRTALEHELTHLIAGRSAEPGGVMEEGLAVFLQEKFGAPGDVSFPTHGHDLHQEAARRIAAHGTALPLSATPEIRARARPPDAGRTLAYLQEGSFVRFLVETYGIHAFMDVYRGRTDWRRAFRRPMADLEGIWRQALPDPAQASSVPRPDELDASVPDAGT
jgi:hypothetical protein